MKLIEDTTTENDLYHVGSVIHHIDQLFIIVRIDNEYGLVDLNNGIAASRYDSLQQLQSCLDIDDVLVTGEHVVDFG